MFYPTRRRGHFSQPFHPPAAVAVLRAVDPTPMFGQEKDSTAKTRIVGSIESLILISDWNPRSVYFPPDTEGWDGELISPAYDRRNRLHTNGDVPLI
jgi:hypothetical protein